MPQTVPLFNNTNESVYLETLILCLLVTMQDGLTALHIACNKGMTGIVRRLLDVLKHQHRFSQKKGAKKSSDCEEVVNARERPKVLIKRFLELHDKHVA